MAFSLLTGLVLLCVLINQSCIEKSPPIQKPKIVVLQPLEFVEISQLYKLKAKIEKLYTVKVMIAEEKVFPASCYYAPRDRYRADSAIKWLQSIIPDSVYSIVGLTNKDISVTKGKTHDYGVMGLGYRPGKSCIVSAYRLGGEKISAQKIQERLFKVVVHEMGHNFGLDHCSNQTCLMVDAEGKMKLDQEKGFCEKCNKYLSNKQLVAYF